VKKGKNFTERGALLMDSNSVAREKRCLGQSDGRQIRTVGWKPSKDEPLNSGPILRRKSDELDICAVLRMLRQLGGNPRE
jgi:hypothetical protein